MLLLSGSSFAQLKIEINTPVFLVDGSLLYTKEACTNLGTLTLNTGTFELGNDFINSEGTLSATSGTIGIVDGETQNLIFGLNDIVYRLALNKTANIATVTGGMVSVTDFFRSTAGHLEAEEKVFLKSTISKTAVVEPSITGTVNNIVVERYIPAKRAFRLISSPVTTTTPIRYSWQENQNSLSPAYANNSNTQPGFGTHIAGSTTGANGFDATNSGNPSLFLFNNTTQNWSPISNTNSNTLVAGGAYRLMVRGDRSIDMNTNTPTPTITTLRSRGTLKFGEHIVPTLSPVANGNNFIGNPYQCAVAIEAVLENSNNIKKTHYYVWDPKVGGTNGRGAFVTYTFIGNVNNIAGSMVNQYLQPMQSFFVKTDSEGPASMVFQENYKVIGTNENVYRTAASVYPTLKLNLYETSSLIAGNTPVDGIVCLFDTAFSDGIDQYDAGKLQNLDENLSVKIDNSKLSIAMCSIPQTSTEYPLNIETYRYQNYTFTASLENYDALTPYLFDAYTNTYTEINNAMNYPFTVTSSQPLSAAANRFKIVFENQTLSTPDFNNQIVLYPNPGKQGEGFYLSGITDAQITLVNLLGQTIEVKTNTVDNSLQVIPLHSLSEGVYMVVITREGKTTHIKWMVKK